MSCIWLTTIIPCRETLPFIVRVLNIHYPYICLCCWALICLPATSDDNCGRPYQHLTFNISASDEALFIGPPQRNICLPVYVVVVGTFWGTLSHVFTSRKCCITFKWHFVWAVWSVLAPYTVLLLTTTTYYLRVLRCSRKCTNHKLHVNLKTSSALSC